MAGHESQGRIASLVSRTISLFDSLLSALQETTPEAPVAASHFSRFKLWVGSMGAHRPSGGRSLEYRLRDASSIKDQIISLLQDLSDSVTQGIPVAQGATNDEPLGDGNDSLALDLTDADLEDYFQNDDDVDQSEIGRILDDIGHVVDCLLRLSMAIRNPAPHDHFQSRVRADVVDHFAEWDVKHAREKFPNTDTEIVERLGRASVWRRQYLKYREEHTQKIADGIDMVVLAVIGGDEREKATTLASSIPSHLKEGRVGAESIPQFTGFSDSESNVSMTSYAASHANSGEMRVPPLPKESENGPFKCPFCCMIVSIQTRRDWKKHVFRDLRPYVCVYPSCTKPDQQYQRRAGWIDHMRQEHWRTWICPFGCPATFASPRDFGHHIDHDHPTEIQVQNLDTLQNLASSADLGKAKGECPLCLGFRVTSEKQYGSHVGTHLEQLSLFTLPHFGDQNDESDDESGGRVSSRDADESSGSDISVNRAMETPIQQMEFLARKREKIVARHQARMVKAESKPQNDYPNPENAPAEGSNSVNGPNAARKEKTAVEGPYTLKCICNASEDDDEDTIYCEKCDTWQHMDCYYPNNVEGPLDGNFSHACVECEPRALNRKQAINNQTPRVVRYHVEPLDAPDQSVSEWEEDEFDGDGEEDSGEEAEVVTGLILASPGERPGVDRGKGNKRAHGGSADASEDGNSSRDEIESPKEGSEGDMDQVTVPQSFAVDLPQDAKVEFTEAELLQTLQSLDHPYDPTGPVTPTTPIIYGNGTMLSDIGEVSEAESAPGKPSPS